MFKKTTVRMTIAALRRLDFMLAATGDWKLAEYAAMLCWPAAAMGGNETIEVSMETYAWVLRVLMP